MSQNGINRTDSPSTESPVKQSALPQNPKRHDTVNTVASRNPPNIDWTSLGFSHVPTFSHITYTWKDGQWDQGVLSDDPYISLHIAATVFHYGQSCFEGLKAFRMKDGKVRVFRPELNAERMQVTCEASSMAQVPTEMFLDAIKRVIEDNYEFVPPYGSNGALYIRPFVIGSGPQVGLSPANEYKFMVFVNPVGEYYKGGVSNPAKALIMHEMDRAAPFGTGHAKLGGNYSPGLGPTNVAKKHGYTVLLFLDAATHSYIEEFATSNFAALTPPDANGKRHYVTPKSRSILNSVTNRSLCDVAEKRLGWVVERRAVPWEEVKGGAFNEVGAIGTAVVITPISHIDRQTSESFDASAMDVAQIGDGKTCTGLQQLFTAFRDLQNGDSEDWTSWNWHWPKEGI